MVRKTERPKEQYLRSIQIDIPEPGFFFGEVCFDIERDKFFFACSNRYGLIENWSFEAKTVEFSVFTTWINTFGKSFNKGLVNLFSKTGLWQAGIINTACYCAES